jgi:hypothetical protein
MVPADGGTRILKNGAEHNEGKGLENQKWSFGLLWQGVRPKCKENLSHNLGVLRPLISGPRYQQSLVTGNVGGGGLGE